MKKLILVVLVFIGTNLTAQTMAFTAVEIKAKDHTQKKIEEAFDKVFEGVEMNQAGVTLERLWMGSTKGMTHRIVWMSTLGIDMIDEGAINPDKNEAFWSKMNNYIEEWGPGTSGRVLSWQEADAKETPYVHIWEMKVQDQNQFKIGHDNIIKSFKEDFDGRFVGFGTYDIAGPNGATHWVALSGKNRNDNLMLYDKLQKSNKFMELIQERGTVENVRDFEIEILKRKL